MLHVCNQCHLHNPDSGLNNGATAKGIGSLLHEDFTSTAMLDFGIPKKAGYNCDNNTHFLAGTPSTKKRSRGSSSDKNYEKLDTQWPGDP
jgi:hypothetical protein